MRSQIADGFAVHGEIYGACRGGYLNALGFEVIKFFGADGFNFGHDNVRAVFANGTFEGFTVKHREHFALIGYLHGRSTGIRIAGNDVLSQTLCGDNKFFAQFAGAKEKDFLHVKGCFSKG